MHKQTTSGFTLVEVLVAAFVAGLCFLGLYAAGNQCMKQVWAARGASRAAQVANCESEFLRTAAWSNITARGSSYPITASSNPALATLHQGTGTVLLTAVNGDSDLLQATIRLSWKDYMGNEERSTTSALIISKYGFLR